MRQGREWFDTENAKEQEVEMKLKAVVLNPKDNVGVALIRKS